MFARVGRIVCRFSGTYFQKNHKSDFTANRINVNFLKLHLDYMAMSPNNFDQRFIVNIYLKALITDPQLSKRSLQYILQNIHKVQNLTSISNIIRDQEIIKGSEFQPLYNRGLMIMKETRDQLHSGNLNNSFKNFDITSITKFIRALMTSQFFYILKSEQNFEIVKKSTPGLGPWHTKQLIFASYNAGLTNYLDMFIDHLQSIKCLLNKKDVIQLRQVSEIICHPILRKILNNYQGTKHNEQFQNYQSKSQQTQL